MQHVDLPTEAFRFELRRQTRVEHQALDRHPAFSALVDGSMDLNGYRRLMLLFHGYYTTFDTRLEKAAARFGLGSTGFVYAARTGILAEDLRALGLDDTRIARNPGIEALPAMETAQAAAGLLYVFEGSLLGASVLCDATGLILARRGLPEGHGNAYWRWCRTVAGPRWAMTCRQIEALSATTSEREAMSTAAREGFRSFSDWLAGFDAPTAPRSAETC